MLRKFSQSLSLSLFVFGFAGWVYIVLNSEIHPYTLSWPLTHFWRYPREDTFGAICFAVSFVSFFFYTLVREPKKH
ncbi:MAG TPA: hypothetical protein VNG90_01480 [Candidatus Acidoferrum sp.]|nr:hypothetical protein [Candidatus Acidoferrum sp.]